MRSIHLCKRINIRIAENPSPGKDRQGSKKHSTKKTTLGTPSGISESTEPIGGRGTQMVRRHPKEIAAKRKRGSIKSVRQRNGSKPFLKCACQDGPKTTYNQSNQITKESSTLTDVYGSDDTERHVVDIESAQSDFEDIKTKCIQLGNNPFLDNFDVSPMELKGTNPFLDNFDDFADVKKETNPLKTDIHSKEKTLLLYREVAEPPEIDPSWFEMDEPELMEIFENSQNICSVLDYTSENNFAINPFLARNPFDPTNKNPFKESIIAKNNPLSGISNEQKMSEFNTCSCPKENDLTLVASRPKHYLKRKVNKFTSWLKSRNMATNSPCYLQLN
ncbi:hypothetical protein HNY73_000659 [Argiope bruennichi]|uniref:Uncharacterized protein n=1 Tax=Argiope bruennichi TaxID=94029 RepID=A0A8T0G4S6_ARGBR|nr:hypothetical protein HNY73_000659 [Argiope bruennichi]